MIVGALHEVGEEREDGLKKVYHLFYPTGFLKDVCGKYITDDNLLSVTSHQPHEAVIKLHLSSIYFTCPGSDSCHLFLGEAVKSWVGQGSKGFCRRGKSV